MNVQKFKKMPRRTVRMKNRKKDKKRNNLEEDGMKLIPDPLPPRRHIRNGCESAISKFLRSEKEPYLFPCKT